MDRRGAPPADLTGRDEPAAEPRQVAVLRDWVDGFWSEALARFKAVADTKGETT